MKIMNTNKAFHYFQLFFFYFSPKKTNPNFGPLSGLCSFELKWTGNLSNMKIQSQARTQYYCFYEFFSINFLSKNKVHHNDYNFFPEESNQCSALGKDVF